MNQRTPRPRSRREADRRRALDHLAAEEAERDPAISQRQALLRARQKLSEGVQHHPAYPRKVLETAPTSRQVPRPTVNRDIETWALLGHPRVAWLWEALQGCRMGRPARRSLVAATLFQMATFGRPDVLNTRADIESNRTRRWAYRAPEGPKLSATYSSLRHMLERTESGACVHVNLDLLDELAASRDPVTGKPRHPDAFTYCAVDGTFIEANVPQVAPPGASPRRRKAAERRIAGPRRPMAQYAIYGQLTGVEAPGYDRERARIGKSCFGYKLVVLSSIKLGLAIVWTLMPASGDERIAVRRLIETLYRLRPDFPMRILVGDALYDNSSELVETLYMRYGVHPCFVKHSQISQALEWARTDGVPTCRHDLMKLRRYDDIWDYRRRRSQEPPLRPGAYAPSNRARLRWSCPVGKCPNVDTYLHRNWRLYTYLPRRGDHANVALRYALLQRRNSIESLFALVKHLGPGAKWPNRTRWGGDVEMKWLVWLTLTLHSARRLAHESGAYERAVEEARVLGLVDSSEPPRASSDPVNEEALHATLAPSRTVPPSTWEGREPTVLDEPYVLPDLSAYSDVPDRERPELADVA